MLQLYTALPAERRPIRLIRVLPDEDEEDSEEVEVDEEEEGAEDDDSDGHDDNEREVKHEDHEDDEFDGDALIVCELATFSLDRPPLYKALSYRWGDQDAAYSIVLNGEVFYVRKNLYRFLSRVGRAEEQGVWLFIDAICINQSDIAERSQQVSLMGDIYRDALEVLVWVDDGNRSWNSWYHTQVFDVQEALDQAEHILENEPRHIVDPSFPKAEQRHYVLLAEVDVDSIIQLILDQPFWSRLWIVQEVLLARTAIVYYGYTRVDLNILAFCLAAQRYTESARPDRDDLDLLVTHMAAASLGTSAMEYMSAAQDVIAHRHLWQERIRDGSIKLHTAFELFHGQGCVRPHDKVFALHGISSSTLIPNYSMWLLDLYIHVLIEGCFDLWHPESALGYGERCMRTSFLQDRLTNALQLQDYVQATSLVADTVHLRYFGYDRSSIEESGLMRRQQTTTQSFLSGITNPIRSKAIASQLEWKKESNGSIAVPDARGKVQYFTYNTLMAKVEEYYTKILGSVAGSTSEESITNNILRLAEMSEEELRTLADSMVRYPTTREAISFLKQAVSVVERVKGDRYGAELRRLVRVFFALLSEGFEARCANDSCTPMHRGEIRRILHAAGVRRILHSAEVGVLDPS